MGKQNFKWRIKHYEQKILFTNKFFKLCYAWTSKKSNLEYKKIKTKHLILQTLDVVSMGKNKVNINNQVENEYIMVDETKMIIAISQILFQIKKHFGRR